MSYRTTHYVVKFLIIIISIIYSFFDDRDSSIDHHHLKEQISRNPVRLALTYDCLLFNLINQITDPYS